MKPMQSDAQRWDDRYCNRVTGTPSPPKGFEHAAHPSGQRWLDVACGLGEQAVWAAQQGVSVVAIDVSPTAIECLQASAALHQVAHLIDAQVVDLDEGLPGALGEFDVVVCQRFRSPVLYPGLVDAALRGGLIIVTVLSEVGVPEQNRGEFHAKAGELVDAFRDLDVEIAESTESQGEATIVVRRR